ncbi:MAG: hypothetical protein IPJ65_33645 [Archangiaceae bacterium]|nr:hypothetical protein [Archangiaceae bacterium]
MSLSELKKAVLLAPTDVEARFALAEAFFTEGKLPEAKKQLEKLFELQAEHPNGRRLFARLTHQLEQRPDTQAPEHWWEAANAFERQNRLDDAILYGQAACDREGDDARRWAELARWSARKRMFERARLAWGRALQLTQREPRLLEERDELLHDLGEDDSLDLWSEAPVGPLHDALRLLLAGDLIAAKRALAMASDALQQTGFFHRLRAEVWTSEGEAERAKRALAKALEFDARPYRAGRLAKLIDVRVAGRIGVLGWTPVGGAVSTLEALAVPGDGTLRFTGNVGEKIEESCQVAYTCLRHAAPRLGIDGLILGMDLHLHFTDIETTKEGFSAGLALTLAGLSALRNRPLFPRLATTGAITLHGEVQRIDGIYEKFVAAKLLGVRRLLYPRGNSADVKQLPALVTDGLELFPVSSLDEALEHAF